jgi:hypothetical protein
MNTITTLNFKKGEYDKNIYHLTDDTKNKLSAVIFEDEYGKVNAYDILSDSLLDFPNFKISNEIIEYIKKINLIDWYYSSILSKYEGRFLIETIYGDLLIPVSFSKYSIFAVYVKK